MSAVAARDAVLSVVVNAHGDLSHAGTGTQQGLYARASQNALVAILDDDVQPDRATAAMTPCEGAKLYVRNWLVRVRYEASGGVAEEATARLNDGYMAAIIAALESGSVLGSAVYSLVLTGSYTNPAPVFGTDANPIARTSDLPIRVQFYA